MSLINNDNSLGIEIKESNIKIGYYTTNRTGYFENGEPKFSVNLYLEYSANNEIYFRKDISIDNLGLNELNFETFYSKMKELEEFQNAKDNIPVYKPLQEEIIPEVIIEEALEEIPVEIVPENI